MRVLKIICWALIVAIITFCFLIGLCAIVFESCTGGVLFAAEPIQARNLDDVHAASCRVVCSRPGSRSGSIGTGTVVLRAEDKYWILTNWHVVNGFSQFKLQFFRDGKITQAAATLEKSWHNEKAPWDFAVLTVPVAGLQQYNPPIVPLAGPDVKPLTDRPIYSSGCSEGRWSLAWKGSIESYYGNTAQFYPAPKSGQSGSAIVQQLDDGLRVTGILTWRVGDERSAGEEQMRGGAIPIANFFDAASGRQRTGDGDSIPPNAAWCADTKASDSKPRPPQPRVWPVLAADTYFDKPAASYDGLELFVFVGPGCTECEKIKSSIARLIKEGYKITTIDAATPDGKKESDECRIKMWPTFILCRDTGSAYEGLERWSGSDSAEQRIRFVFARHARRGLPPAPRAKDTSHDKEAGKEADKKTDTGKRNRTPRKIDTPDETFPVTPAPAGDTNGAGSGDVSPLLDQYGSGAAPSSPALPQQDAKPAPEDEAPPAANKPRWRRDTPSQADDEETGLIDKVTAPLTQRLNKLIDGLEQKAGEKLDAITTDLSARAETIAREKIDEIKPDILACIKTFLWSIIWRAAIIIAACWYGFYWIVRGIGWLCAGTASVVRNMPTIKIERPQTANSGDK